MLDIDTICNHLHDVGLLTDDIKNALMELFEEKKSNVKMPFGKFKGKTIEEIYAFNPEYLRWVLRQEFVQDKFIDICNEIKRLTT